RDGTPAGQPRHHGAARSGPGPRRRTERPRVEAAGPGGDGCDRARRAARFRSRGRIGLDSRHEVQHERVQSMAVIAIDGPSGVGKSSTSKEVARRLGYGYLDTGAMYRATAWLCLNRGVTDPGDVVELVRGAELEISTDP